MSKNFILVFLLILNYNCYAQLSKLTDILSTAHHHIHSKVDQVAGAVLGGLTQDLNFNIGGHINLGNGQPPIHNRPPSPHPPPYSNNEGTTEVIVVVVEDGLNEGQNEYRPQPQHHRPHGYHGNGYHQPNGYEHNQRPSHGNRQPFQPNRPNIYNNYGNIPNEHEHNYRPPIVNTPLPSHGYNNNGHVPNGYEQNEQTNQNGSGNLHQNNYGNTNNNNYGNPNNGVNDQTTEHVEKETEKNKPAYGDIKPSPKPNYEAANNVNGGENGSHNYGTIYNPAQESDNNNNNNQKPNENSHKTDSSNVIKENNEKTTKKPDDDIPLFVPLNPNEYQYGGDKIIINAPKRETDKNKQTENDEDFPIDIRFKDE